MRLLAVLLAVVVCCNAVPHKRAAAPTYRAAAPTYREQQKRTSNFLFFPGTGECTYEKLEGKKSPGSVATDAKTLEECDHACSSNSNCRAFEFNEQGTWKGIHCRLHQTHGLFVEASATVDTYIRQPCMEEDSVCHETGQDDYEIGFNAHIRGGTPYFDIPAWSMYECIQLCTANPFCFAVDYSRKANPWRGAWCWLHEDQAMYIDLRNKDKWDFYWKTSCEGDAPFQDDGNLLLTMEWQELVVRPGEETKEGECPEPDTSMGWVLHRCQELCTHDANCGGATKCCNTGCGHECLEPVPQVMMYGRAEEKKEEEKRKPKREQEKRESNYLFFPGSGTCTYDKHAGMKSSGAVSSDAETLVACEMECSMNSACRAYEFSEMYNNCFLHETHDLFVVASPTVDTYIRDPCTVEEDPGEVCHETGQDEYSVGFNAHILGGTPYFQIPPNQLYECIQLCNANPFCFAVDYSRKANPWMNAWCWLHEDRAMYIDLKASSSRDFYWKTSCEGDSPLSDDGNLLLIMEWQKLTIQPGEETRPGSCPVPDTSMGWVLNRCSEDCGFDAECPAEQKCCDNGCGHSCVTPVWI